MLLDKWLIYWPTKPSGAGRKGGPKGRRWEAGRDKSSEMTWFKFGKKDITRYLPQKEQRPLSGPHISSSCCFAQYTISLHNRQNNLIFSLATELSFQSIIPQYIKKNNPARCHISACWVLRFPCQGICKSIALTILSTNYLQMPVMSPTVNVFLINNASGSGEALFPPHPWDAVKERACSSVQRSDFSPGAGACDLGAGRQSEGWRRSQTGGQLAGSATTVRSGLVHAKPCTSLHLSLCAGPQGG